jgi:DNA polymerase III epsilon subunit-like protein
MAQSMQHWNGNMVCAIDCETTGIDPAVNEICQLAILPLDSNLKPIQNIIPFNIHITPSGPEAIDPEAMSINKKKLSNLMLYGVTPERAVDLFIDWMERLPLPMTRKGGHRCRVIPLGCNFSFDKAFIMRLLGADLYDCYLDPRIRDVMEFSLSINDCYGMNGQKVRYSKNNLTWLCKQHEINTTGAHDALVDCRITANLYREMLKEFSQDIPMVD